MSSVYRVRNLRGRHGTEMALLAAGVLAFSSVLCIGLNAQVSGGVLSGTVMDASQAAIPNVRVTLTNVATGVARAVATDATGLYTVPDLLPGSYEMTATALGFTTQVRTDITVNLCACARILLSTLPRPFPPLAWKSRLRRGTDHLHTNVVAPDSICVEGDLVRHGLIVKSLPSQKTVQSVAV